MYADTPRHRPIFCLPQAALITASAGLLALLPSFAQAQRSPAPADTLAAVRFADLHIHTSFKHFYGDLQPAQITDLLRHYRDLPYLQRQYGQVNWDASVPRPNKEQEGKTSKIGNYNQSDYTRLTATPGSVFCTSLYPYEKQFAVSGINRFISSKVVSGIPLPRLRQMGQQMTPFDNFKAEYAFLRAQQPQQPNGSFRTELARDQADLQRILHDPQATAQVLTIEGGHVLYGPLNAAPDDVREAGTTPAQLQEMLANVDSLRRLPHKVLFITPAHFTDNRIAGFSKTLDRPGLLHVLLAAMSWSPKARTFLFRKYGEGIHGELDEGEFDWCSCPDLLSGYRAPLPYTDHPNFVFGDSVLARLLAPDAPGSRRILIDVKHFDVQARHEYYDLARRLAVRHHLAKPIPIIAGHVGVSGESQGVAAATGLNPLFDRYSEINNPLAFYRKQQSTYDPHWRCHTRYMYKHGKPELNLYFANKAGIADSSFNPFRLQSLDTANIGWFYPWSINLSNEEIKIIYDSNGIIGLNFDQRILGGYMLNYSRKYAARLRQRLDSLNTSGHVFEGLRRQRLDPTKYCSAEPFIRNMLHLVLQSGRSDRTAWDCIAIGSDFDGLIDPLDVCPTAAHIPDFYRSCSLYLEAFWLLHRNEPAYQGRDILFGNTLTYQEAIEKVFFRNGRDFVLANF